MKKILDSANYIGSDGDLSIAEVFLKGKRLIVSYSAKRARKDAHDRNKAMRLFQHHEEDVAPFKAAKIWILCVKVPFFPK